MNLFSVQKYGSEFFHGFIPSLDFFHMDIYIYIYYVLLVIPAFFNQEFTLEEHLFSGNSNEPSILEIKHGIPGIPDPQSNS